MVQLAHVGFHNCLKRGSYESIRRAVPFLSRSGPNQWLTQGYYFWTDDPECAFQWNPGRDCVISEFVITFDSKDELLDLVGNARDIRHFRDLCGLVEARLAEDEHTKETIANVSVNQVISFLRELENSPDTNGIFPYAAVKAQDEVRSASIRRPFVDGRRESLVAFGRQQMCVYEHARNKIQFVKFLHPQEFCEEC